ncbi:hypothetical protein ACT4UL_23870, partial [Bacillus sp. HC-TM]
MFRRPTCMESCQSKGHDYDYCLISCYPPTSAPTYPYLIPNRHSFHHHRYETDRGVNCKVLLDL